MGLLLKIPRTNFVRAMCDFLGMVMRASFAMKRVMVYSNAIDGY